jgi:hypothetical protein
LHLPALGEREPPIPELNLFRACIVRRDAHEKT